MTRRSAFTLVELLIVISIIGVLMGLLIPAVGAVKESMKRTTCVNNQKQLALAVLQFENSFRRFPGYVNCVGNGGPPPAPNPLPASWAVVLFPYIDHADLWSQWSGTPAPGGDITVNSHRESHIEILICPTNPPTTKLASMWAYAVNGGYAGDVDPIDPTNMAPPTVHEHIFNGAFFNHWGVGGFNMATMVTSGTGYISEHDGVANTVMLTENLQQFKPPKQLNPPFGHWTPGPPGWRSLYFNDVNQNDVVRSRAARAVLWFDADRTPNPMAPGGFNYHVGRKINFEMDWPFQDPTPEAGIDQPDHSRPSSLHPNGVVMAFCDGHVRFVKQTISYNFYKQLLTSYGTKAGPAPNGMGYDSVNLPYSESEF